MFAAFLYGQHWITAPLIASAPLNYLNFLKNIEEYRQMNVNLVTAAAKAMKLHLWYLSEELISLAFFSDVEINVKRKMKTALRHRCLDNRPAKK